MPTEDTTSAPAGANLVAPVAEGYLGKGLTADDLVERAVRSAGHGREVQRVRWSWVGSVFGLGSTSSARLCRRFGLDPDELIGTDPDEDDDHWDDEVR